MLSKKRLAVSGWRLVKMTIAIRPLAANRNSNVTENASELTANRQPLTASRPCP
jgi:hypothetical protein